MYYQHTGQIGQQTVNTEQVFCEHSSVPKRSADPNEGAGGRIFRINKLAIQNKRASEISCKKMSNVHDLNVQ